MHTPYTGTSAYCFTNSLHMSLKAAGWKDTPEVGFLECLTTMLFGKFYLRPDGATPLLFPSGPNIDPDSGLTSALGTLGWTCDDYHGGEAEAARACLSEALKSSPVLAGPVDMGSLTHMPGHEHMAGSDHFVLVLAIDGDTVRVHDPAGYPYARLPLDDFMRAWRADQVTYGQRPYHMRWNFRQVETVSRAEMMERTLPVIRDHLRAKSIPPTIYYNGEALRRAAEDVRTAITPDMGGFLLHFALPLGARRMNDAADFLHEAGCTDAARTIAAEAACFGESVYPALHGNWEQVAARLDEAADWEDRLAGFI
jgi:hypothetical protein